MSIEFLNTCSLVILLAPLAGAVLAGGLGPRVLRGSTHWAAILGVGAAFAAAVALLRHVGGARAATPWPVMVPLYSWMPAGPNTTFDVEILVDPLTAIMLVTVTGVALLVVIYSRDYMRHQDHPERGYERFFAYLGLFVFSMCALVLGGNFLLLYLGWEAVGLCSYLLIGFYYQKPAAAAAAKKAFLVNRVGDFGFGLGILLIYWTFQSLDYATVFDLVQQGVTGAGEELSQGRITTIALLLFCGACGKSAQLPLHVWLPDAMEGPSPVSALIHAATMVTAGVFMVARCGAIFTASSTAMAFVGAIGAVTALFAATVALVQTDMKRVLAYSTISQLGYMFLGLGVYAADSAIFHLFTHAFFKALLFLGAGSVMHAMGGIIDVRYFSGLRSVLPWTYRTFFIGSLALAGFPLFAGFFSKDEILHHALQAEPLLGAIGLLTALLTTFYTFRIVYLAFFGPLRTPEGVHAHESGVWMIVPLVLLSVGAIGAGYLGSEGTGWLHGFLQPVFAETFAAASGLAAETSGHVSFWSHYGLMILSGALAILGMMVAYAFYARAPWIPDLIRGTFPETHRVLQNKYYFDELYQDGVVEPARRTGKVCVGLDDYLIDGLLWCVAAVPKGAALLLRTFQSGLVQGYALSMTIGLVIILMAVFVG